MPKNESVRFVDRRGRRVVYVSSCLLDQNRRYPGIAVSTGALMELLGPLVENGTGIEQLPCLECMGWGGISRASTFRFIPVVFRYADSKLFPIVRRIARVWLLRYGRLCRKEAQRVAKDMKDFVDSGYNIVGIIAMNDSPTCGVTRTIDILDLIVKSKALGLKLEDLTSPRMDMMMRLLPGVLVSGRGLFMRELLSALKRQAIMVPVFEFNPWNDLKGEAGRVIGEIHHRA